MKSVIQIPGALPKGFDLDSLLTPEQFCVWANMDRRKFGTRARRMPGVIRENRKHVRVHPRTYLEARAKKL